MNVLSLTPLKSNSFYLTSQNKCVKNFLVLDANAQIQFLPFPVPIFWAITSINGKHKHTVIYVSLGTIYADSNGWREPEPYLKAGHTNGQIGCGRRCRWPGPRPLAATCGCLAAGKSMQGRWRQDKATSVWLGSRLATKMAA
jgi:hypothetical protein